jgi:hypothetical protein
LEFIFESTILQRFIWSVKCHRKISNRGGAINGAYIFWPKIFIFPVLMAQYKNTLILVKKVGQVLLSGAKTDLNKYREMSAIKVKDQKV